MFYSYNYYFTSTTPLPKTPLNCQEDKIFLSEKEKEKKENNSLRNYPPVSNHYSTLSFLSHSPFSPTEFLQIRMKLLLALSPETSTLPTNNKVPVTELRVPRLSFATHNQKVLPNNYLRNQMLLEYHEQRLEGVKGNQKKKKRAALQVILG